MTSTDPLSSPRPAPWDRFGWVMGVIWLVFLAFPVLAALELPRGPRVAGLLVIGSFAAAYTHAFVRFPHLDPPLRVRTVRLVILIALAGLLGVIIGPMCVSLTPFIVAYAVFHQPLRRAMAIGAGTMVAIAAVLTLTGAWSELWFMIVIVFLVAISTGATAWIEQRDAEYTRVAGQYQLLAERERVARDVHDVLGHTLTVITVKSELARRLLDVDEARARTEITEIESLSREALSEIRATVAGLRVARLGDELEHARDALNAAGIDPRIPHDPDVVDPRYRLVAAWVLREAVTNVVRHSGARACEVHLRSNGLAVLDDGRGPGRATGAGSGLRGARERVETTGGRLTVDAEAGGGTRVEVQW